MRTSLDYSNLATRVIARGAGVTADTVLTVTVDDAAAQTEFGIITAKVTDQTISDLNVLEAFAEAELARRKQPRSYLDIDTIDLSKTDVYDYAFEARLLVPGTVVNVITGYFDSYTRVERVEVDLDDPLHVEIDLGNPEANGSGGGKARSATKKDREDLAVIIAELIDKVDDLQNDRGEVESVRQSLDPVPRALDAVATWDEAEDEGNLPEKLADLLDVPYGDVVAVDSAKDGIVESVVDAIENDRNGIVEAIEAVSPTFALTEASDRDTLGGAMSDGELGRTTGTSKIVYAHIDGRERPLQIIRAANLAALDPLVKSYELGTSIDDELLYFYGDGTRMCLNALT